MPRNDPRPIERLSWTAGSSSIQSSRKTRRKDLDRLALRLHDARRHAEEGDEH